ncbi:MAG: NAD-dependent epimerase/dehydratase family protein, partial [Armatimonadetes bacterium]|nr:NAD-dependent epimerase/dehydratase family protein [Armatimonadota bacterium]
MSPVLVTGTAGFIGYHLTRALLQDGETVVGLDSVNDYYSVQLKRDRLANLRGIGDLHMVEANLADRAAVQQLFDRYRPRVVVNLAAQAGVRHSLTNPHVYVESNVTGFMNILESCRYTHVEHLVYASSSSVYGANQQIPFSVLGPVDHPISIYAATKRANELMAHTYSHLYGLPTSGLRFFSVYGPWGRPDMALFMFTRSILAGEPIEVFNNGELRR